MQRLFRGSYDGIRTCVGILIPCLVYDRPWPSRCAVTEAERDRLTDEWFATHAHEWDTWNAIPLPEQAANLDKIDAARNVGGPLAAREMARALGLPMPPDELAIPLEILEARRAKIDFWLRNMPAGIKLTQVEIDDLLRPRSAVRMDH